MPFHIHGSQMNGFPPPHLLPSSSHLSLLLSFPFFLPPSSHCSGQLPSITVTGRPQHRVWGGGVGGGVSAWWKGRGRRRRCVYGCDERRRQSLTYQRAVYVYRCVYMCVGMRGCFRAWCIGVFVWYAHGAIACHTPWLLLQRYCDNNGLTFVKDKYIPLRMKLLPSTSCGEKYIYIKKAEKIMTPAAMIVGIRL